MSTSSQDKGLLPVLFRSHARKSSSREYKYQGATIDDFDAGTLAEHTTPPMPLKVLGVNNSEVTFLAEIAEQVVRLAFSTYALMPVTFALAWYGYYVCMYIFIILKVCLVVELQFYIGRQINVALQEKLLGSLSPSELDNAISIAWPHSDSSWQACERGVRMVGALLFQALRLLEAIDPDSDAMTPGVTRQAYSDAKQKQHAESWAGFPLIGSYCADLGLPGVIACGVTSVWLWQVYNLSHVVSKLRQELSDTRAQELRHGLYGLLYHTADTAGLNILQPRFKCLFMATCLPSMRAFWSRVPEILLQGWFAVSALAVNADDTLDHAMPLMFSVLTSFIDSILAFYDTASVYLPWRRFIIESANLSPHRTDLPWLPARMLLAMVLHFVGFSAICARLLGVWCCSTHDFRISEMACQA